MICSVCQHNNHENAKFCSRCGQELKVVQPVLAKDNRDLTLALIFFLSLASYLLVLYWVQIDDYIDDLIGHGVLALLVTTFFCLDFKRTSVLFRLPKLNVFVLLSVVVIAPLLAWGVVVFGSYLNEQIFGVPYIGYYYIFVDSPYPMLSALLSIAFFPALFEEVAFRGVLFNFLEKIAGVSSTVIITAVMFSLMHFSLLSLLWLFPIGLVFGALRAKHNTLWYGMIGHFIYNSCVVIFDFAMAV